MRDLEFQPYTADSFKVDRATYDWAMAQPDFVADLERYRDLVHELNQLVVRGDARYEELRLERTACQPLRESRSTKSKRLHYALTTFSDDEHRARWVPHDDQITEISRDMARRRVELGEVVARMEAKAGHFNALAIRLGGRVVDEYVHGHPWEPEDRVTNRLRELGAYDEVAPIVEPRHSLQLDEARIALDSTAHPWNRYVDKQSVKWNDEARRQSQARRETMPAQTKYGPEVIEKIKAMNAAGQSQAYVAEKLGFPNTQAMRAVLRHRGIVLDWGRAKPSLLEPKTDKPKARKIEKPKDRACAPEGLYDTEAPSEAFAGVVEEVHKAVEETRSAADKLEESLSDSVRSHVTTSSLPGVAGLAVHAAFCDSRRERTLIKLVEIHHELEQLLPHERRAILGYLGSIYN